MVFWLKAVNVSAITNENTCEYQPLASFANSDTCHSSAVTGDTVYGKETHRETRNFIHLPGKILNQ